MEPSSDRPRDYRERHSRFWRLDAVERPLVIFTVGGWSPFLQGDQIPQGEVDLTPGDLRPEVFVRYYKRLFEIERELADDGQRAAQPYPAIPWMEGIIGCAIRRSGEHYWSGKLAGGLSELAGLDYDTTNGWARTYNDFLDVLAARLPGHPVGQSILRGPADLLAAALGDEAAVLALNDDPDGAAKALETLTDVFIAFVEHQWQHTPAFLDGYVVGQYDIWAPARVIRTQEDAVALYSPRLYRRFVLPCDERLCAMTPYTLMHLHATHIPLLDAILSNRKLGAVQMSKDEGGFTLAQMLPAWQAIQRAGRPLVVKGRFALDEVALLKSSLSPSGLCVQPVVDDVVEAQRLLPLLVDW